MYLLRRVTIDRIDADPYEGLILVGLIGVIDPPRADVYIPLLAGRLSVVQPSAAEWGGGG